MDWTLCLLCTLISMTSTRCHQQIPAYHRYDRTEIHGRLDQTQWTERDSRGTQRISQTQISRRVDLSDYDQAAQRMSERSLPLHSDRQTLQDVQRRFNQEDEKPRIVNVNKDSGFHSAPRRGVLPDSTVSPDLVVFPGPTGNARRAAQFVPSVPEECMRTGICEDVPDYPEEHVAAIIEQLGNATEKYRVDELDTPEIAQRIGSPEEMELCVFDLRVVIPKSLPDKDGIWHYIINRNEKPLQGFAVEICKEDKSPCAKLVHVYSGYEARCKQKYMLRYMAGLNYNGEMVEKDFRLPSCCSCVVRQTD